MLAPGTWQHQNPAGYIQWLISPFLMTSENAYIPLLNEWSTDWEESSSKQVMQTLRGFEDCAGRRNLDRKRLNQQISIFTSLNCKHCNRQLHTFCSDGVDLPMWIEPEKLISWGRRRRKNKVWPFCSACMCLPRCRAPTQLRARPQPSFQTCVTDPTNREYFGWSPHSQG